MKITGIWMDGWVSCEVGKPISGSAVVVEIAARSNFYMISDADGAIYEVNASSVVMIRREETHDERDG